MKEKLYLWLTREITIYRSFWLYWILLLVIAFFVAGIAYTDDGNKCPECGSTEFRLSFRVHAATMPGCECSTWVCGNGHKWTTHRQDQLFSEIENITWPWPTPAIEIVSASYEIIGVTGPVLILGSIEETIQYETKAEQDLVIVTSIDHLKGIQIRRTFQFQDGKMVCIKKEELTTILKWVEVE